MFYNVYPAAQHCLIIAQISPNCMIILVFKIKDKAIKFCLIQNTIPCKNFLMAGFRKDPLSAFINRDSSLRMGCCDSFHLH